MSRNDCDFSMPACLVKSETIRTWVRPAIDDCLYISRPRFDDDLPLFVKVQLGCLGYHILHSFGQALNGANVIKERRKEGRR